MIYNTLFPLHQKMYGEEMGNIAGIPQKELKVC